MLRITTKLINTKSLWYRNIPATSQVVQVSRWSPRLQHTDHKPRDPCPQRPKPPPPPPKDDKWIWASLAALVVAGSFAVYAKQNPEVRDWLTIYAPWFDDFIAIAYQENCTYSQFAKQCLIDAQNYLERLSQGPKECYDVQPLPLESGDYEDTEVVKERHSEKPAKIPIEFEHLKDIDELQNRVKYAAQTALNNYMAATKNCKKYLKTAEEAMSYKFSMQKLKELHNAKAERLELDTKHINAAEKFCDRFGALERYLDCEYGVEAKPKEKLEIKQLINELKHKILVARVEYEELNDQCLGADLEWPIVEESIQKYINEVQTMFPTLDYTNKDNLVLRDDPDVFLIHTKRYLDKLRNEYKDGTERLRDRIDRAACALPKDKKAIKARCKATVEAMDKARAKMNIDYEKRLVEINNKNLQVRTESLKQLNEKHAETLVLRLKQKEEEMNVKLKKQVAEKVAAEKLILDSKFAEMCDKLHMIENKLKVKLKAENERRKSQKLYSAAASLLNACRKGQPIVKVNKELDAIEKAAGDEDKLVNTVLKAIPDNVREKGVVPFSVLRKRYHTMEEVALRVALIDADGAPLPIYALSYLQSLALFMKFSTIPQAEIDKPPKVAPPHLDTFDLMQRARYWVEHGNLARAMVYVNALQGASRVAAANWYQAAREHVETKQAAEAIISYAAALSLQYI